MSYSFLIYILLVAHGSAHLRTHKCVHEQLDIDTIDADGSRSSQNYQHRIFANDKNKKDSLTETSRRRLVKANMHIHVEFSSALSAGSTTLDTNIKKWMNEAATFFEEALKVDSVTNLKFDLFCNSAYPSGGTWTDGSSGTGAGQQCATYASPQPTCNGIVIPSTWYKAGKTCSQCYDNKASCTGCTDIAAGDGLISKDYAILVEAVDTTICQSSVDGDGNQMTLGYAAPCKYDQYDRPILGSINFCPIAMAAASAGVAVSTAKHELAHALGFTAGTIPYFRDPTTSNLAPRTPRGADGKPAEQSKVCVDGNTRTLITPASTTLDGPTLKRGFANAYTLITPNIAKAAKEHFNCATTIGIELENQPTGDASSCWGSHWEQRALNTELMTPVVDQNSVVSQFTLGFFEDTGWYEPDYSKSEYLYWGKDTGCDFLDEKCNKGTKSTPIMQQQSKGYFCDEKYASSNSAVTSTMTSCTHNGLAKGYCSKTSYSSALPSSFQYFTNSQDGGALAEADYCPMYSSFSTGQCADTTQQPANGVNYNGDLYSSTSKCIRGTMVRTGYVVSDVIGSACAGIACSTDGSSAVITLKDANGDSQTITCAASDKNTGKAINGFGGLVTCPDLAVYCPKLDATYISYYKDSRVQLNTNVTGDSASKLSPSPSDNLGGGDLPAKGFGTMKEVNVGVILIVLFSMMMV